MRDIFLCVKNMSISSSDVGLFVTINTQVDMHYKSGVKSTLVSQGFSAILHKVLSVTQDQVMLQKRGMTRDNCLKIKTC